MAMSSSSKSGDSASVRWIAESPSLAVPTSCAPSALASSSCSRSAANGSSSAIKTRSGLTSTIHFHRHRQGHLVAAVVHWAKTAARPIAEPRFKTLADVGNAEPGTFVRGRRKLVLAAMLQPIADLQQHPTVEHALRLDADDDRLAALGHAIFDCILDDRLEQQRRQPRLFELLGDVDFDVQSVGETRLLDVQVQALQVDLFGQGHV